MQLDLGMCQFAVDSNCDPETRLMLKQENVEILSLVNTKRRRVSCSDSMCCERQVISKSYEGQSICSCTRTVYDDALYTEAK